MDEQQIQSQVGEMLATHGRNSNELVPILLSVQQSFGYLPEKAIYQVGEYLNITSGQVYSVASFYKHFQLKPVGKRRVTVCRGTACHIRGAPQILSEIEKSVGIAEGETSADMEYTLETVACIGCCALAPCLKVNEEVHGVMTPIKAKDLFKKARQGEKDAR